MPRLADRLQALVDLTGPVALGADATGVHAALGRMPATGESWDIRAPDLEGVITGLGGEAGDWVRHRKGGLYQILHRATHSETGEEMIVYRDARERVWVRPAGMFSDTVLVEETPVRRFAPTDGPDALALRTRLTEAPLGLVPGNRGACAAWGAIPVPGGGIPLTEALDPAPRAAPSSTRQSKT